MMDVTAFPAYAQELSRRALALGAKDAVPFLQEDIPYDTRTLLKCMFGCKDWGFGLTCPSRAGAPAMAEYREMFSRYQWGLLIHANDKNLSQQVSLRLESEAFLAGFHFAFSLSDCGLCKTCAGFCGGDCAFPDKARPALHSVGIDVFRMARRFNLPLYTLRDETQEQNWYSALFVE